MAKEIHCIQFLNDRVIIEFKAGLIFQFCKKGCDGKHFKNFLGYYANQFDFSKLDLLDAAYYEKRFSYELSHNSIRGFIKRELHEQVRHFEKRIDNTNCLKLRRIDKHALIQKTFAKYHD